MNADGLVVTGAASALNSVSVAACPFDARPMSREAPGSRPRQQAVFPVSSRGSTAQGASVRSRGLVTARPPLLRTCV
jgi:hypothetical protein